MKKIGKYEICGLLGKGGMGAVYKVRMPVIGKMVALKRLAPHPYLVSLMGEKKVRELFVSEALTMARLRHPHIVDIWDFHDTDDLTFFVMEYYCNNLGIIIGESYRIEEPSRRLAVDQAIDYTRQILLGLSRLHDAHIIHRDIKPYNILVTDQNQIKITDFGLSKLRGEVFQGPENLNVGTPYYAPPEQEESPNDVDERADLYSLGVMFYRMLTGNLPLEPSPPLSQVNPDLDEQWDAFFSKSISKVPEKRFGKAKDMLKALKRLEIAWEKKRELACQAPPTLMVKSHEDTPSRSAIRSHEIKVGSHQAQKEFGLDDHWRPQKFVQNLFHKNQDGTVTDKATGLVWEQAGSAHPVTWHEAKAYITQLNEKGFAGRRTWRMPTVSELMTLLTDIPQAGDLCLEPVFDQEQRWLWSTDRRSFVAAWYVSAELGYVSWQDFSCNYYVRAISS
jgi:serine/threonine-protein kinase